MDRYVILKKGASTAHGGSAPGIEVADLSEKDVADAARDGSVDELAPIMPMELIDHCDAGEKSEGCAGKDSWGIGAVGADIAGLSGAGVTVAVIDSGISKHPAFDPCMIEEKDFSGSGNGDKNGHGTHCAGTIFGRDVGGRRIGVARGVKRALIAKVTPDVGKIESDMVFGAMIWALHERADIVSMSLGFDYPEMVTTLIKKGLPHKLAASKALVSYRASLRLFDAVMEMMKTQSALGVSPLIVAAAGNQSRRHCSPDFKIGVSLPAAAADVISVAAIARQEGGLRVANFSNVFPTLAAPGVDILSARLGGGLKCSMGTSTACPHVAGVAALWLEKLRNGTRKTDAARLAATLRSSARKEELTGAYDPSDVGFGVVAAPPPNDAGTG